MKGISSRRRVISSIYKHINIQTIFYKHDSLHNLQLHAFYEGEGRAHEWKFTIQKVKEHCKGTNRTLTFKKSINTAHIVILILRFIPQHLKPLFLKRCGAKMPR